MRTGRLLVVTFELFQAGHPVKTFTPQNSSNKLGCSDGDSSTAYTMWLELPMTRAIRDIFESQISKLPISRWTAAFRQLSLNPWRLG